MIAVYKHVWTSGWLSVLLVLSVAVPSAAQGRRVVDMVRAGDAASEREHDYAGDDATTGVIDDAAQIERAWAR